MKIVNLDVQSQIEEVRLLNLLATLKYDRGDSAQAEQYLQMAKESQIRIITRSSSEVPDMNAQRQLASELCVRIAEHYERLHQQRTAIEHYRQALTYVENDPKVREEDTN